MARIDQHVARLKARNYQWPIPWPAVEALARSEDCRFVAYLCSAGVPTIGWGETEGVTLGMRWTEDQVDARFFQQVVRFTQAVQDTLTAPTSANQLGAMVRLAYNIGLRRDKPTKGGFYHSSVRKLHNAGDYMGAANAFRLFNKARDPITKQLKVLDGLTYRRADESAMYLRPDDGAPGFRMPQAVEHESKLTQSPLVKLGATVAGGGGVVGASVEAPPPAAAIAAPEPAASAVEQVTQVTQVAQQVGDVAGVVTTATGAVRGAVHALAGFLNIPPGALLAGVFVGVGVGIVYWRWRQRREGWA